MSAEIFAADYVDESGLSQHIQRLPVQPAQITVEPRIAHSGFLRIPFSHFPEKDKLWCVVCKM
ncbi:MAG TPA: hypothetical protein VHS80_07165 [Chthoniobacterales bacterium]|nr:hypothetical protein [Chthoniobacterales bacterium]